MREKAVAATGTRGPAAAIEKDNETAFLDLVRPVEIDALAGMRAVGDVGQQLDRPDGNPGLEQACGRPAAALIAGEVIEDAGEQLHVLCLHSVSVSSARRR